MLNQKHVRNYDGPLFLEVPSGHVLKDVKLVDDLNALTKRIIHNFDKPGITTWEFNDLSAALKGVLVMQETKYPFRLIGENDLLFIEVIE